MQRVWARACVCVCFVCPLTFYMSFRMTSSEHSTTRGAPRPPRGGSFVTQPTRTHPTHNSPHPHPHPHPCAVTLPPAGCSHRNPWHSAHRRRRLGPMCTATHSSSSVSGPSVCMVNCRWCRGGRGSVGVRGAVRADTHCQPVSWMVTPGACTVVSWRSVLRSVTAWGVWGRVVCGERVMRARELK